MRTGLEQLAYAARTLRRNKRFATLAIASLGIAIALNTTMYSVLDAIVFPRIAMHRPDRLYNLSFFGDYRRLIPEQDRADAIAALNFYSAFTRRLPSYGANMAERGRVIWPANVVNITPNYFAVLGNQPSAGRLLSEVDVGAPTRPVVVSERLWKRLFPQTAFNDSATFLLDGELRVVVGLLPHEADFPGANTDVWQIPLAGRGSFNPTFYGLVRLRDGVDAAVARGELKGLAERISMRTSGRRDDARFVLRSAVAEPLRVGAFHKALIGAVVFVLLVACVNLANLQLARGVSRARELATRAAIGASRRNLITQMLLESSWLAFGGLLLGVVLTFIGMKLVIASVPPALDSYLLRPQTSWRVFAFAGVVTLACLVIVGLLPAIRLSRVDINEVLKTGAGTGTTKRRRFQYGALVVVQVAMALTLLVGATLLLRVSAQVANMELRPGIERIVQAYMEVKPVGATDRRRVSDVSAHLVNSARAVPTVADAAAMITQRPTGRAIALDDPGGTARVVGTGLWMYGLVTPSYVRTLGIGIVRGRDFSEGEFAEPSVIVDELTARYLWPGANPVGRLIKMGDPTSKEGWLRVVGVAEHFNYWAPFTRADQEERQAPRMGAVYVLNAQDTTTIGKGTMINVVVKGTSNVHRLPSLIRRDMADPGRGIAVGAAEDVEHRLGLDMLRERQNFVTSVFMTFALLALGVAALGVYAIVSHTVSQRRREFGVRIAVGASSEEIRGSVLREGNLLALLGIAIGLVLASQTVQMLRAFLRSDEDRYDSWLYAIAAAVLLGVMLVASWLPARHAMRINPTEALRND